MKESSIELFDSREVLVARPLAGARESHGDRPWWELHTA